MTSRKGDEVHEAEVWPRAQSGDRGAFSTLMREHGHAVYRYAWRLADDRAQVEDLVQETFLRFWQKRSTIRVGPGGSVLPWLLTTCRFLAYNTNRQHRQQQTVPLERLDTEHGRDAAASDELRDVQNAIEALSPSDRELCRRCLLEGEPYDTAAAALGLTTATARKRIQRVRTRLLASRNNH